MSYIDKDTDAQLGIISEIYQEKIVDENTAYLVFEVSEEDEENRVYCILDFIDYDEDFASSIHSANKAARDSFSSGEAVKPVFENVVNEILEEAREVSPESYGNFSYCQEPEFIGVFSFSDKAEVRYGEHSYRLPLEPEEFTESILRNSNLRNN